MQLCAYVNRALVVERVATERSCSGGKREGERYVQCRDSDV
jgi:hypothetical protein